MPSPAPRREFLWISDISGEQIGVIGRDLLDLSIDERLDQSEALSFSIPATSSKSYLINSDVDVRWSGDRFYMDEIESRREGTETTIDVVAVADWYRLGDDTRVGSTVFSALTPEEGLAELLAGTGWEIGSVSSSSATFSMEQQDKSVLALLRTWAAITGLFLRMNSATRTVDLTDVRGADLGLGFRYRRNLLTVRRRVAPPELTVLFPYGADGLNIAGVNGGLPYLEDFSYYTAQGITLDQARARYTRSKVWSDRTFLVDADLKAAATQRLSVAAQPVVSYELAVVDLSDLVPGENGPPRVGDTVRVADPDFGENLRTTVVRTVNYPLEPWRNRIELAYILNPTDIPSDSGSRSSLADQWVQFVGRISAPYQIRNDGDYIVARIPLSFRTGGRAHYSLDLEATGIGGDGTLIVDVVNTAADPEAEVFRHVEIPYTNGVPVPVSLSWAAVELSGEYDYRVRVTTVASGGPSSTKGVDITVDREDEASFWIMAQGATQQTPTAPNSARYEYTGAVQTFQVPDGVTEVEIEVAGSRGGHQGATATGRGGKVTATFPVVPGTVYNVVVGGTPLPTSSTGGGWPNGGNGSNVGGSSGAGGGGSSHVSPSNLANALLVAGGGGGAGQQFTGQPQLGGDGGFFTGGTSPVGGGDTGGGLYPGGGATQTAGGTPAGGASFPGAAGTAGQGGNGPTTLTNPFTFPPGGGGGGWYGGAGGGGSDLSGSGQGGGGGGGSGWLSPGAGFDILLEDGANDGPGYVEFRWEDPV